MNEIERRKLLAFDWLASVADTPVGWGTLHLDTLRNCWLSGLQLLEYIESLGVFQAWKIEKVKQ